MRRVVPWVSLLAVLAVLLVVPVSAGGSGLWGPYLSGTNDTATILSWRTASPGNGSLSYANGSFFRSSPHYDHVIYDNGTGVQHHLLVSGLEPGTMYQYSLSVEGYPAVEGHFTTFPIDGKFTFIVYGDTQDQLPFFTQDDRHRLVADRIAEEDPLFVIHTGDLTSDGLDPLAWDRFFSAGGRMLANSSFFPVPGNHEENSTLFSSLFMHQGWYSFDCGDAHFTLLDSNTWAWARMDEQVNWLSKDLSGNRSPGFMVLHHPMYTSEAKHWGGRPDLRGAFSPAIAGGRVTVVFSGDVHAYERDVAGGVTYLTAGTGGGPAYALAHEKIPEWRNSLEQTLGYLRVTVDPDRSEVTVSMVRVADLSPDTGGIARVYPPGTIFEMVQIRTAGVAEYPDWFKVSGKILAKTLAVPFYE
ncbi:MAG: metallophosphoesterase family protein [Methanoregulaceae archaeon]|nr:metallophosphoesterase family protein [Methanoregulaceae archaeon]